MLNKYDVEWLQYENLIIKELNDNEIKEKIIFYEKNAPFNLHYCPANIIQNIIKFNNNIELKYWKIEHLRCLFKNTRLTSDIINFLLEKGVNIDFFSNNQNLTIELVKEFKNHLDLTSILCNSNISFDELLMIYDNDLSKLNIDYSKINKIKNKFIEKKKEKDLIKNANDIKKLFDLNNKLETAFEKINNILNDHIKKFTQLKKEHKYLDQNLALYYENATELRAEQFKEIDDKFDNLKLIQEELYYLKEDMETYKKTILNFIEKNNQSLKDKITTLTNNIKYNNNLNSIKYNNLNNYITLIITVQVIVYAIIIGIQYFKIKII
jgi:hypothetical protein